MNDIFKRCDYSEYCIQRTNHSNFHKFIISKNTVGSREYFVTIPKVGIVHGSRFGSCSCGFHKKEGCPCNHMVAIVKSGGIPNMTNVDLMPYWYTRAQWQLQFPKDFVFWYDCTWKKIKETSSFDGSLHYCPGWAAGGKKGRPKKNARKLGISDHIQQAAKKRHKASTLRSNTRQRNTSRNTTSGRNSNHGGNQKGWMTTVTLPETVIEGEWDLEGDVLNTKDTKDGVVGTAD